MVTKHDVENIAKLARFKKDFSRCDAIIISDEAMPRSVDGVEILPWREGIAKVING